jgi:hypothetical protein
MRLEFKIYADRANAVELTLTDANRSINHLALTRAALYVGATLFDSQAVPDMFDLTAADHVSIKLGDADPALAEGLYTCRLIVFDSGDYAKGYVWPEDFDVRVIPEAPQ